MKPLMLKAGERSLTKVVFNREGDLLFSCTKDKEPVVWFSENGERLGTYVGHNGALFGLDVSYDSTRLITGSGDLSTILWDTQTGKRIAIHKTATVVRSVGFSYSAQVVFYTTLSQMNKQASLNIVDMREGAATPWMIRADEPNQPATLQTARSFPMQSGAYAAVWSGLDHYIVTGSDKGELNQYDLRSTSADPVNFNSDAHNKKRINDLQISADQTCLLSSSKDHTAKLFDARTLETLKTYKSERPVNSASISPSRDHIILGGGEEAMTVTQTATSQGAFEAKLYHLIFEDEFARIKGHFGPINTIAFHPSGRSYASGAEDGYVRIQAFDQDYTDFDYDY